MQYIDIDSSYRNRNKFPNQADFDVLPQQTHICCPDKCDIRDGVSTQSIIYPNPQENPQVAFFEETLQEPLGAIVQMTNLPLMYSTETDVVIQLDEFVIRSLLPTTDIPVSNTLYPRGSIPLGEGDEFYTNNILEDVRNEEYRTITAFNYINTPEQVFQSGLVLDTYILGNDFFLTTSTSSPTQTGESNIDRYYVGKFLKLTSGAASRSVSLIINYTAGRNSNAFQLDNNFGTLISNGDSFEIISDRKWFATIASPFSNPIASYPCYRNPLPDVQISFFQNVIAQTSNRIEYISVSNMSPIGTGIAYVEANGKVATTGSYPLANMYYIASTDNSTDSWNQPTFVYEDVFLTRIDLQKRFTPDVDNPVGVYPVISYSIPPEFLLNPPNPSDKVAIYEQFPYDINGFKWDVSGGRIYGNASYTDALNSTTPPDRSPTIHMVSNIDNPFVSGVAYVIYNIDLNPTLYYGYSSSNPFAVDTSGTTTEAIHVIKLFTVQSTGRPALCYFHPQTTNNQLTYILSSTITGNSFNTDTKYIMSSVIYPAATSWYMSKAIDYDMKQIIVDSALVVAIFVAEPSATGFRALYLHSSNNEDGDTTNWFAEALPVWDNASGLLGTRFIQHNSRTYLVGWRTNTGLQIDYSDDVVSSDASTWNGPIVLDSHDITDVEMVINNDNELLIVYSRLLEDNSSELVTLKINNEGLDVCNPYRIRKGIPLETGGLATLTGNEYSITLPSYAQQTTDLYSCQYIYIYSTNVYEGYPNPFVMFNDFKFIQSYDITTNTLEIANGLTNDVSTTNASMPSNEIFLSFENTTNIGQDFSGNQLDFDIGSAVHVSSYTDNNYVTLSDVTTGGALSRDGYGDTLLINLFNNPNQLIVPFTISVWFLTETNNNNICIIDKQDSSIILIIKIDSLQLLIQNTSSSLNPLYSISIELNTWYHLVLVSSDTAPGNSFVYLNNVLQQQNNSNSGILLSLVALFDGIEIGDNINVLYLKDFVLSASEWSEQQALNAYHSALQTPLYTLSWEILADIKDFFNPLDYTNTNILTSQEQCYEIELTHLILPNVTLSTGFGNRIAFYPYIYVEFSALNNTNLKAIHSNNPNTSRVLFKVPIRDTSTPDRAKFVQNTGGMRQVVKFKPNDTFHFAVYLPNGDLFTTLQSDTLPPLEPDILLQLSATFGFKLV